MFIEEDLKKNIISELCIPDFTSENVSIFVVESKEHKKASIALFLCCKQKWTCCTCRNTIGGSAIVGARCTMRKCTRCCVYSSMHVISLFLINSFFAFYTAVVLCTVHREKYVKSSWMSWGNENENWFQKNRDQYLVAF